MKTQRPMLTVNVAISQLIYLLNLLTINFTYSVKRIQHKVQKATTFFSGFLRVEVIAVKLNRYKWAEPSSVKGASASRYPKWVRSGSAVWQWAEPYLCERRVRVQGSDMGPLRILCFDSRTFGGGADPLAGAQTNETVTRVWRLEGGSA